MATIYIHYVFFPSFQFNSRKTPFYCLMLKVANFSWLWVSWVSFAYWFLVFLSYCYFFFFFYSCIVSTTGTTTTITNSDVSKREGTLKTNYKLWSSKFRNFRGRKERTTPKHVLLLENFMRISFQPPLVHYIYICACISFLLISFYLWLILVFLFNRHPYDIKRHNTTRHDSRKIKE